MKPQAAAFLDKSRELLERAATMLNVGLNQDAGRAAYVAGFHAVQAFLFEQHGKAVKTHKSRFSQFACELPCNQEYARLLKQSLDDEAEAVVSQARSLVLQQPCVGAFDWPAALSQT